MPINYRRIISALVLTGALASPALAAVPPVTCSVQGGEEFHYTWRLRGGLAWLAGLRFPTSGFGKLRTVPSPNGIIDTELKITPAHGDDGFYLYQSQLDKNGARTLSTYHAYQWGDSERHDLVKFDYAKKLARIQKQTPEDGVENRVKPIPPQTMRDILTGIFFLRQNADSMTQPVQSNIYTDGRLYSVIFSPAESKTLTYRGKTINARGFRITAAPKAEKRYPGAVTVWLSNDEHKVPVRIEIAQSSLASLQLNLDSVDFCD